MTSIVTDFRSIKRKLDRMEQKAEFEAQNPEPQTGMYGWPYGVTVPYAERFDYDPYSDTWGVSDLVKRAS